MYGVLLSLCNSAHVLLRYYLPFAYYSPRTTYPLLLTLYYLQALYYLPPTYYVQVVLTYHSPSATQATPSLRTCSAHASSAWTWADGRSTPRCSKASRGCRGATLADGRAPAAPSRMSPCGAAARASFCSSCWGLTPTPRTCSRSQTARTTCWSSTTQPTFQRRSGARTRLSARRGPSSPTRKPPAPLPAGPGS